MNTLLATVRLRLLDPVLKVDNKQVTSFYSFLNSSN